MFVFYSGILFISMREYNKQELEELIVEQNKSYSAIGKLYGVSDTAIKKVARRLGIPLSPRRKINKKEIFSHPNHTLTSLVNRIMDEEFIQIIQNSSTWKEIGEKLGYSSKCLSSNVKKCIYDRCSKLGVELHIKMQESILDNTKGELFNSRKNWQSARSAIRKLAQQIYLEANCNPKCAICGYSHHIEVAHIKAVSDFDDNVTIREIDSVDNLIGLCPNHHWEYDNGILEL